MTSACREHLGASLLVASAVEVPALVKHYVGPQTIPSLVPVPSVVKLEGWVRPFSSKCGLLASE